MTKELGKKHDLDSFGILEYVREHRYVGQAGSQITHKEFAKLFRPLDNEEFENKKEDDVDVGLKIPTSKNQLSISDKIVNDLEILKNVIEDRKNPVDLPINNNFVIWFETLLSLFFYFTGSSNEKVFSRMIDYRVKFNSNIKFSGRNGKRLVEFLQAS